MEPATATHDPANFLLLTQTLPWPSTGCRTGFTREFSLCSRVSVERAGSRLTVPSLAACRCSSVSSKCPCPSRPAAVNGLTPSSLFSTDFPENLLVDAPEDASSRWAGEYVHHQPHPQSIAASSTYMLPPLLAGAAGTSQQAGGSWIVLELKKPAVLQRVLWGKFHRRRSASPLDLPPVRAVALPC
jgi:hypothetical protein